MSDKKEFKPGSNEEVESAKTAAAIIIRSCKARHNENDQDPIPDLDVCENMDCPFYCHGSNSCFFENPQIPKNWGIKTHAKKGIITNIE